MKIKFLQTDAVNTNLIKLIDKYDEFHWAVAWGNVTGAAKQLLEHPAKFENVTFGVDFCHTDPELVDQLIGIKNARIATKFAGGTYHPKVYCFRKGAKAAAIVGSANFTFGGLGKNLEAAILVKGDVVDPFFTDLFDFVKRCASLAEPITLEFSAKYRDAHLRASRLQNPVSNKSKQKQVALKQKLVSMNWAKYVEKIKSPENHHNVADSLKLLRIAQKWLASVSSFSELSQGQRQAIAGTVVKADETDPDLKLGWGWFGSMKGNGDFARLINGNDADLARAMDSLPNKGKVSRLHFDTFVKHFKNAFENSSHTGGYPTASRLLAMKRPDTFICLCNPNIALASEWMGFARTTLGLDDYWDKVIDVIHLSEWYNANKPDDTDGELWECRVAMLDAIFYWP